MTTFTDDRETPRRVFNKLNKKVNAPPNNKLSKHFSKNSDVKKQIIPHS
jgi:hypothetical protein